MSDFQPIYKLLVMSKIMPSNYKESIVKEKIIQQSSRAEVIRDTIVLQLKLIVDGLRDLALMPLVLIASLLGLIKHKDNPGRYLYRLLSYGKATEKWIGLFNGAKKDDMQPVDINNKSFDELLKKTQIAIESKYIDDKKKQKLLEKFNLALDEINLKLSPRSLSENRNRSERKLI
ncbi:MAG: hypothetical protein L3J53_05595 [Proteobacteria bacterium]|nr:hypothetical protein [Pseudomonadota bacterium]